MATTLISTQAPVISWDPGISGVGVIYVSGTQVDNSQVTAVQNAATAAGVGINVGTAPAPPDATALTKASADRLYDPIGAANGSVNYTLDGGTP